MQKLIGTALLAAIAAPFAHADITTLDLASYQAPVVYNLSGIGGNSGEVSGVTWNSANNRLYVVEDEGETLYELSLTGTLISSMTLTGFDDLEGITYIGNNQLLLAEERLQDLFTLTYTPGGTVNRSTLSFTSVGPTVGNIGTEGVSYDPRNASIVTVKEKTNQEARITTGIGGTTSSLFTPNLGVLDLADVQVLSVVGSLSSAEQDNLLVLSQEGTSNTGGRLFEVNRTGQVLGFFDLAQTAAEGVTVDAAGNIYVVAESGLDGNPNGSLLVYAPTAVPVPAAVWLLVSGLGALGVAGGRKRKTVPAAAA